MRRFIINVLSHPFSRSPFALNLGHIATAMLPRFMTKSDSCKRALDSHLFFNNLLMWKNRHVYEKIRLILACISEKTATFAVL